MEERILCKCGCGCKVSLRRMRAGRLFLNQKHAAKWRGEQRKGKKMKAYNFIKKPGRPAGVTGDISSRSVDYALGPRYCANYNDEDIRCVMCYEQNLRYDAYGEEKTCFEKPKRLNRSKRVVKKENT